MILEAGVGRLRFIRASSFPVEPPLRRKLELRDQLYHQVYFSDSGLSSMVVSVGPNDSVEVAIRGHEGMTGMPVLRGADRGAHDAFIQTAGQARRIGVDALCATIDMSASLRHHLRDISKR
jgi:hypothetical protein